MTRNNILVICRLLSVTSAVLVFCGGCASPKGVIFAGLENQLVWPQPPEQGRIHYMGSLSTELDLKRGTSWGEGLGELIFGKKEVGIAVSPSAVVLSDEEKLYVADSGGNVIHIFDLVSREYRQFSTLNKKEKLMSPVGLALADERVYVVDSILHKVCVFNLKGRFLFSFGEDILKRPSGIAYHPARDMLFITDTGGHVVNVFDKSGERVDTIGSRGIKAGQFNFPTHLWVDKDGVLYVSDTLNYRVQLFRHDGTFLRMFGGQGDRPGYFAHPAGIATDRYGNIYVADRQFENIQVFDNNGQILMAWGAEGSEPGEFWLPAGICVDNKNRIFVADSFNKRVQVFELLEGQKDGQ